MDNNKVLNTNMKHNKNPLDQLHTNPSSSTPTNPLTHGPRNNNVTNNTHSSSQTHVTPHPFNPTTRRQVPLTNPLPIVSLTIFLTTGNQALTVNQKRTSQNALPTPPGTSARHCAPPQPQRLNPNQHPKISGHSLTSPLNHNPTQKTKLQPTLTSLHRLQLSPLTPTYRKTWTSPQYTWNWSTYSPISNHGWQIMIWPSRIPLGSHRYSHYWVSGPTLSHRLPHFQKSHYLSLNNKIISH